MPMILDAELCSTKRKFRMEKGYLGTVHKEEEKLLLAEEIY